jgi:hypothetical protein
MAFTLDPIRHAAAEVAPVDRGLAQRPDPVQASSAGGLAPSSAGAGTKAATAVKFLGLAASPSLALLAAISASGPLAHLPCASSAPGPLSIHSMAAMYLTMSLFHLQPWLKLPPAESPLACSTRIEGSLS